MLSWGARLMLLVIGLTYNLKSVAQDQPIYNHFYLNPFIVNPSFAGESGFGLAMVNYRQQWTGIPDAPVTYTFVVDTPIKKKLAFGLVAYNDTRGIISTSSGEFTLGYKLNFSKELKLAFGLSAGAATNNLDIANSTDLALTDFKSNNFAVHGRAGWHLQYSNHYLGFALPNILKKSFVSSTGLISPELDPLKNFIVMGGTKIPLGSDVLTFSPSVLYRVNQGSPQQFEGVAIFEIKETVWVGGSYKQGYGFAALGGLKYQDVFTIGYAYELPTGEVQNFGNGTHEIQLSLRLGKNIKKEEEERQKRIEAKREKQRKAHEAAVAKKKAEEERLKKEEEARKQREADKARKAREAEEQKQREAEEAAQRQKEAQEQADLIAEERRLEEEQERITAQKEQELNKLVTEPKEEAIVEQPVHDTPAVVLPRGNHMLELPIGHYVVIGAFSSFDNAEKFSDRVFVMGYKNAFGYSSAKKLYYVYIYKGKGASDTRAERNKYRKVNQFSKAWYLHVIEDIK